MHEIPVISADALRQKLSSGEPLNIIDIRPQHERTEWYIPGSMHLDVYDKLQQNDHDTFNSMELDPSVPVVTVCGSGKTSLKAADLLTRKGYKAFSLENGMKGWNLAWNTAYQSFHNFEIWQVRRTGKGCLSYIIASDKEALIIDAALPLEVYSQLVQQHNLSIKFIIETHIHADHLSRSKELAAYFRAPLFLPVPNKVQFAFYELTPETIFSVGSIKVTTIPTPGHTLESVSFYIEDIVLFTGDTLFTNGVGRPDLKSNDEESRKKSALLYHSLKNLLLLPDNVWILPAHTNKPVAFDGVMIHTTIGEARRTIPLLQSEEADFVSFLLKNIPPPPANYQVIVEKNLSGDFSGINPVDLEAGANRCAIS